MSAEVTDPELLAKLNAPEGAEPVPGEVTDPVLLAKLNGEGDHSLQHPQSSPIKPMDEMEFGDQASLSQMDNTEEYRLYAQHRYGKDNVTDDWTADGQMSLLVKTPKGLYRIGPPGSGSSGPSYIAKLAGESPVLAGTIGGAVVGAEAGPIGAIVGAGVGGMLGADYAETAKAVRGEYSKSAQEGLDKQATAGVTGAASELGGRIVGKAASKALTFRVPKFISGATDESIAMTKRAMAGGAIVPYASMGPDYMYLRRVEVMGEKMTGKYAKQDKVNMAFVQSELETMLRSSGMPSKHVDALMAKLSGPEIAASNTDAGEMMKAAVKAHVNALTEAMDQTAAYSDAHINAQIESARKVIDGSKTGNLAGDFEKQIESAHKDFKETAKALYDRIDELVGRNKIVPTIEIGTQAKEIAAAIREASPTLVSNLVKDLSTKAGREIAPDDAILMSEFGLELPSEGKMSIQAAQRLRTVLRDKAGAGQTALGHSVSQRDYGKLADAVDRAIQDAAKDPAASQAVEALSKADAFWKRNIGKFDNAKLDKVLKEVKSGAPPDPEGLVALITKNTSSAGITRMRGIVGEDIWKRIQGVHLNKYLGRFEVTDFGGKKLVNGMALLRDLEDGDGVLQLRAVHGKDAVTDLREIAKMSAARRGDLDPAVMQAGGPKAALVAMKRAEAARDEFMKTHALAILSDDSKTGEEAYQWLARGHGAGGDESRLKSAVDFFGKDSPQMKGLQQAALEEMARNASISAIEKAGNNAIADSLQSFSAYQRDILFPGGLAKSLNAFNDVIKFIFPFKSGVAKDSSMTGMKSGEMLSLPLKERWYHTAVAAITRFIALHPVVAKTLVTGRAENSEKWMMDMASLVRRMSQTSDQMIMNDSSTNIGQDQQAHLPQRPGQPPTPMPASPTIQ